MQKRIHKCCNCWSLSKWELSRPQVFTDFYSWKKNKALYSLDVFCFDGIFFSFFTSNFTPKSILANFSFIMKTLFADATEAEENLVWTVPYNSTFISMCFQSVLETKMLTSQSVESATPRMNPIEFRDLYRLFCFVCQPRKFVTLWKRCSNLLWSLILHNYVR